MSESTSLPEVPEDTGLPQAWVTYITPFADSISTPVGEVTEKLKCLVGDVGTQAIELLQDEDSTPFEDLKDLFTNVPKARLKKAIATHLRTGARQDDSAGNATLVAGPSVDVLPPVPEDESWLQMLKSGGVLRVSKGAVIAAIRGGLASRTGLFDLPGILVDKMEAFSEQIEEPVGSKFYELRDLLTRRRYSEIFDALEIKGQARTVASQRKKNDLLKRIDQLLWPELLSFNTQLTQWVDSWQKGAANPAVFLSAISALTARGGAIAPLVGPPPTDVIRGSAEAVVDKINRIFAGTGIPVAMAIALDARQIKEALEDTALPSQVGAATRDQMLKELGVAVSADYVRLERTVTRYVLSLMDLPGVTPGQDELTYLVALWTLGQQIQWDKIAAGTRRQPAARPSRLRDEDEDRE